MKFATLMMLMMTPLAALAAEPGAETRAWLQLQREGASAATDPRPLPGDVASQMYQRYLRSFSHPIPERFEVESFTTESSGSGS